MTDLQAKIAALPEWGSRSDEYAEAALARLALARKWIASQPHGVVPGVGIDCAAFNPRTRLNCTCGRDALLEALEVPRD